MAHFWSRLTTWGTPRLSHCRHVSIPLRDLTVAAVIHLSHYELSWGVFCFLINGWCHIVSDREAGKAFGSVCVCFGVCVCVYIYTPVCFKLRPLAVTPVLITLQPEQPQALSPPLLLTTLLLLLVSWLHFSFIHALCPYLYLVFLFFFFFFWGGGVKFSPSPSIHASSISFSLYLPLAHG